MTTEHVHGSRNAATAEAGTSPRSHAFNDHLAFFDRDRNGAISVAETVRGLERLGFGYLLTVPGAVAIHAGVAALGVVQKKPVSARELELPRTGTVRHPDTRLIDDEGNFDEARLDALFAAHGKTYAGEALTVAELAKMVGHSMLAGARRSVKDALLAPTGVGAAVVEWGALFWVAGETRDGAPVLEKSAVRSFFTDPRFFEQVADRLQNLRAQRAQSPLGRTRNLVQRWLF